MFIATYILSRIWAFLIPGVIITIISLIFLLDIPDVWYLYPLAVGASFIAVYLTQEKNTYWAIIPGAILVSVAAVGAMQFYFNFDVWPIILIAAGVYILYRNYR
jgi:hypothetical protein